MDASISRVGASIMVNRVVASGCRRVGASIMVNRVVASMVVDRVGAFDHCRQGGGWVLGASIIVVGRVEGGCFESR